jgi:Ca2+-binding EF-hand superfamily protein
MTGLAFRTLAAAWTASLTATALRNDFVEGLTFAKPTVKNLEALDNSLTMRRETKATAVGVLKAADTNGDHRIDRDEAAAFRSAPGHPVSASLLRAFDSIDANGDGLVDLAELVNVILVTAAAKGKDRHLVEKASAEGAKILALMDVNKDQMLSEEEVAAFLETPGREAFKFLLLEFEHFDEEHDGRLTAQELTNMLVYVSKAPGTAQQEGQPEAQPAVPLVPHAALTDSTQDKVAQAAHVLLSQADLDHDGVISREEAAAVVAQPGHEFLSKLVTNFETFDKDSSNTLDLNELTASIQSMSS